MNLTKEKKSAVLTEMKERLASSKSFVIAEYLGTKVSDIEKMRKEFYDSGLKFQVAKNSLFRIALKEKNIEIPQEIFDKPITICWGFEDEIIPAKKTMQWAKTTETFKPIGVVLDGLYYDEAQVKVLANLPGKEELIAKLVSTLNAPIANFVYVLSANISNLVNVLQQISKQKSE